MTENIGSAVRLYVGPGPVVIKWYGPQDRDAAAAHRLTPHTRGRAMRPAAFGHVNFKCEGARKKTPGPRARRVKQGGFTSGRRGIIRIPSFERDQPKPLVSKT